MAASAEPGEFIEPAEVVEARVSEPLLLDDEIADSVEVVLATTGESEEELGVDPADEVIGASRLTELEEDAVVVASKAPFDGAVALIAAEELEETSVNELLIELVAEVVVLEATEEVLEKVSWRFPLMV